MLDEQAVQTTERPLGADQHHPGHPEALAAETGASRRAFVVGGGILALLLSAYALEQLKFSSGLHHRASASAMVMISGALAGYFFVLPQWRKVTDEQVALYLEECEPTLETAILSALEAEKNSPGAFSRACAAAGRTGHRAVRMPSSTAAGSKRSRFGATRR